MKNTIEICLLCKNTSINGKMYFQFNIITTCVYIKQYILSTKNSKNIYKKIFYILRKKFGGGKNPSSRKTKNKNYIL